MMDDLLNQSKITNELNFILHLLKDKMSHEEQIHQEALCNEIDWDLFLQLTMHHRVYPLIRSKLKCVR